MTAKPSVAPTAWADFPFPLIPTPSRSEFAEETHSYVFFASEMALAHNVFIRALNSVYQQAPYVKPHGDPSYNSQDVKDLLHYVACWAETVNHHHHIEETLMFPDLERLSGKPGSMDDPKHQHELIHGGLDKLLAYAESTEPVVWRWEGGMKDVLDSFTEPLMHHLSEEIALLMTMKDLDSGELKKIWVAAETKATKTANLGMLVSKTSQPETVQRVPSYVDTRY